MPLALIRVSDSLVSTRQIRLIALILFFLNLQLSLLPGEQYRAQAGETASEGAMVTLEIRYHNPQADEVVLRWGVNGWLLLPECLASPNTVKIDKVLETRMVRRNHTFIARIYMPANATFNHGLLIRRARDGYPIKVWWDDTDDFSRAQDSYVDIESRANEVTLERRQAWLSGKPADFPLVEREIRYHAPDAGEVWLQWGVDGWRPVPRAFQPKGTVLNEGVMRTPLTPKDDRFTTTLRIPPGSVLDYKFLITKTRRGLDVNVVEEQGNDLMPISLLIDSSLEIESDEKAVSSDRRRAWLAGQAADLPLLKREFRYLGPGAGEVWLVWGIDGWQVVPEAARPPGSILKNGLLHTPMVPNGSTFTTTVQVPPGSGINYRFLVTKSSDNTAPFSSITKLNGQIDLESHVTRVEMEKHKAWPRGRLADPTLVSQELRYRLAGAEEVWLVWGINQWQTVPEEVRPPGTVLKDKVLHSPMVRRGDTFSTIVKVPPGTMLDYKFLVTKTGLGGPVTLWQDHDGKDFWKLVKVSGTLEEKATVTIVSVEQRKAWLAGQALDLPLVTQELQYQAPGASEVWLVWGVEGWQTVPESARPKGTILKNGRLHTPMARDGQTFHATVRLPPGTEFNFLFLIARTEEGRVVDIRQRHDADGRPLSRVVAFEDRINVQSTTWLSAKDADSLVTQDIRYRIGGAEEVWLVWGINGWQSIPEEIRPPDTVLKGDNVMHSRMVLKGDAFVASIRVPTKTLLDYKFLITKTLRGAPVHIWQDNDGRDFRRHVRKSGKIEETATVTVVTAEQRKAWLAGQALDLPLVTQELQYQAPGAGEVWLVWGVEGWQTVPESARPKGTILKNGRLHTPMARDGQTFHATVRLPPGTEFNFLFLIARTEEGRVVDIRQRHDADGRPLSRVVAFDEKKLQVQSRENLSGTALH